MGRECGMMTFLSFGCLDVFVVLRTFLTSHFLSPIASYGIDIYSQSNPELSSPVTRYHFPSKSSTLAERSARQEPPHPEAIADAWGHVCHLPSLVILVFPQLPYPPMNCKDLLSSAFKDIEESLPSIHQQIEGTIRTKVED